MHELILGGARSGKSALAQQRAAASSLAVTCIVTATPDDAEMAERIAHHRANRPPAWHVVEEPIELAAALMEHTASDHCLLVDCLTLWLSNILSDGDDTFDRQRTALLDTLPQLPGRIILVGNEIGLGVIPMGKLTRRFVDENGRLHQEIAARCERVSLCVAGLPLSLKEPEQIQTGEIVQ